MPHIRRVAYLPPSQHKQTVHIRPPGSPGGKQFDAYPFAAAVAEVTSDDGRPPLGRLPRSIADTA